MKSSQVLKSLCGNFFAVPPGHHHTTVSTDGSSHETRWAGFPGRLAFRILNVAAQPLGSAHSKQVGAPVSQSVSSRSPRAHYTTISKDGSAPLVQHKY